MSEERTCNNCGKRYTCLANTKPGWRNPPCWKQDKPDRIASLEAQLRERDVVIAAMREAANRLNEVILSRICAKCGTECFVCDVRDAQEMFTAAEETVPADALKRWAALERVVEAAKEWRKLDRAYYAADAQSENRTLEELWKVSADAGKAEQALARAVDALEEVGEP